MSEGQEIEHYQKFESLFFIMNVYCKKLFYPKWDIYWLCIPFFKIWKENSKVTQFFFLFILYEGTAFEIHGWMNLMSLYQL